MALVFKHTFIGWLLVYSRGQYRVCGFTRE